MTHVPASAVLERHHSKELTRKVCKLAFVLSLNQILVLRLWIHTSRSHFGFEVADAVQQPEQSKPKRLKKLTLKEAREQIKQDCCPGSPNIGTRVVFVCCCKDPRFRKMMLGLQSKDNKTDLSMKKRIVDPLRFEHATVSCSFLPGGTHERARDILQMSEDQSMELSEQKKIEWQGGYIRDVWTEEP